MTNCCATPDKTFRFDPVFHGSLVVILLGLGAHFGSAFLPFTIPGIHHFGMAVTELLSQMWWGILIGILMVGLMQKVPREYFIVMLGKGEGFTDLLRAALAGVLLDLCSHGILMVAAKLYERGVSLPQVITFLIASPWNSFSLTLILIALIGLPWTLAFIAGSVVVAIVTGLIYQYLIKKGKLPTNPHREDIPEHFRLKEDALRRLKSFRPGMAFFTSIATDGWREGQMVLRWILLGTVIAALIRAYVPTDFLADWFGPTLVGLLLTLIATTIIEVCSEGAAPIGAELVTRAAAPGNGFAFLMAGVATDYTEILVLRQMTGSWKATIALPLITVPQILLLGWLMNQM